MNAIYLLYLHSFTRDLFDNKGKLKIYIPIQGKVSLNPPEFQDEFQ